MINGMNIALIGDAGVGKTCFLKALKQIPHEKRYFATIGCEVNPISVDGTIVNIWDFAGAEKYRGLSINAIEKMNHILIMYEKGTIRSKKNANTFWKDLIGDIPHTFVMTKCDDDATGISAKNRPNECIDVIRTIIQQY